MERASAIVGEFDDDRLVSTRSGPPTFQRGDLQPRMRDVLLHADSGRMLEKHGAIL
jgi:hypothetical protein